MSAPRYSSGVGGGPTVGVSVPVAAELDDATRTTTTRTTVTRRWQREEDMSPVSLAGNALWIVAGGGGVIAFVYLFTGLVLVCTVALAPFGLQLIKLGRLALAPFGKHVRGLCNSDRALEPMDAGALVLNALWFPIGLLLMLFHLLCGLACACTCYGIIFTHQHLKLAQVALLPFGAEEHSEHVSVYEETTHLSTTTYGSGGAAVATAVPVSLGKAL